MHAIRDNERFFELVEKGEAKVYVESLLPMTVKEIIIIFPMLVFFGLFQPFFDDYIPLPWMVSFIFLFALPQFVIVIFIVLKIWRTFDNYNRYYVKGQYRKDFSRAIHLLDFILSGESDAGEIQGDARPEELLPTATRGYHSTIDILKTADEGLAVSWKALYEVNLPLKEKQREERILSIFVSTVFVLLLFGFALYLLDIIGILRFSFTVSVHLVIIGLAIPVMLVFVGYLAMSLRRETPLGFIEAVRDAKFREQTERALESIIQIVKIESKYPLRVLVTGNYEGLDYSQKTYTTSSGLLLKAAVIFPLNPSANVEEVN